MNTTLTEINSKESLANHLKSLHAGMNKLTARKWSDLDLGHGLHATKLGERYTLSESARGTVLDYFLALNHQLHAEALKAGLHDKKRAAGNGKRGAGKKAAGGAAQGELISPPQPDLF